ncbi:MAG: hypothetical protein M3P48_05305, partial [Actinomycetota bacterium]|nr:hypothetical protein [Actinomycetota bacterium]
MSAAEEAVTRALSMPGTAVERRNAVLVATADALDLGSCHLYARDDASSPYRLVTGWSERHDSAEDDGVRPEVLPLDPLRMGGAAQAAGEGPGLELPGPQPADLQPVPTPVGPLLPLTLSAADELDAVVLMGPRRGRLSLPAR